MARLCERPGCSRPADVMYGISAEQLTVWIESFERSTTDRGGVLCLRHADAMVVPLGWMLDDRREPIPRLFKAPASTPVPSPRRPRSAAPAVTSEQLVLTDVDEPRVTAKPEPEPVAAAQHELVPEPEPEPEPDLQLADDRDADPTEVLPWKPVFDQNDDLDGLLHAQSPLLARAFRGSAPRS